MGVIKIAGDQWPPLIVAELFKPYEVVIGVHKVHIIKENDLCYAVVFYILADCLIHDVVITHIYHCDVLILVGKVWHNCVCVAVLYNKDVFIALTVCFYFREGKVSSHECGVFILFGLE